NPTGSAEWSGEPDRGRDEAPPPPVLELFSAANGAGDAYPLNQPVTLVGRHPNCDLRLLDDTISYFQCALVRTPDGAWCVDIFSPKGTRVNGRPTRLTRLNDGDLVEFKRVSLVVRSGGQAGRPIILNPPAAGTQATEALAVTPQKVAESVTGAVAPIRE